MIAHLYHTSAQLGHTRTACLVAEIRKDKGPEHLYFNEVILATDL